MARGRKRKAAPRTPSGQLSRASIGPDRGNTQAQAKHDRYGQDGVDAIGRAYCSGLLGEGNEAKALLDTARNIANVYWQTYATGAYSCPLALKTHGPSVEVEHERIYRRQQWLNECLSQVGRMGYRKPFFALVIDVNPDQGPQFLDAAILAAQQDRPCRAVDRAMLNCAIKALGKITAW